MRSHHKALVMWYRIANYGCMLTIIAVVAAMDFGVLPRAVAEQWMFVAALVLGPAVGYFITWVGAGNHATKFCARCGKDIGRRYLHARRVPSPDWLGTVIICEDCVQQEDLELSLPNRDYSHRNARLAVRWKREATPLFVLLACGFPGIFFVTPGTLRVAACVLLALLWLGHRTASARSSYYRKSFCVRCRRDLEQYEWRTCDSANTGAIVCEGCDERQRGNDYGDGWKDGGNDGEGEMSCN